jgi:starch synthase
MTAVLFATSEAVPLVKTGGLADVSGALPQALAQLGHDVRVLLPGYRAVLQSLGNERQVPAHIDLPPFAPARILRGTLPGGVPVLVLDCPPYFDRDGGLYQRDSHHDWPDNDVRFGLLSRVAAVLAGEASPLDWRPDVLHCNDWQTGLAPVYATLPGGRRAATILTIHNLAYQGIFPPGVLPALGMPWDLFRVDGVEYYGNVSFLKAGVQFADRITTVSPTYAREIQHEPLGFGMQGLLSWRSGDLTGILNGIDTAQWDPAADPLIAARYRATTLPRKELNRKALRERFGLESLESVPVAGVVSRFAHQKGLDLLVACAESVLALPMQLVVLGSGDSEIEHAFRGLAAKYPGRFGLQVGFDEALSHLVEAGADLFLMPSRFEPCGLNQMYSQRYGTPVVARATGGLVDSVTDVDQAVEGEAPTGFLFTEPTPESLFEAVARAAAAYADRRLWRRMQRAGMARDFSWTRAAGQYAALYRALSGEPRKAT